MVDQCAEGGVHKGPNHSCLSLYGITENQVIICFLIPSFLYPTGTCSIFPQLSSDTSRTLFSWNLRPYDRETKELLQPADVLDRLGEYDYDYNYILHKRMNIANGHVNSTQRSLQLVPQFPHKDSTQITFIDYRLNIKHHDDEPFRF